MCMYVCVKAAGHCSMWEKAVPGVWVLGSWSQEISRHGRNHWSANASSQGSLYFLSQFMVTE